MKPELWGKHIWYTMHFVALNYPNQPSPEDRKRYQAFFESFQYVLPCSKCAEHYLKTLADVDIRAYLDSPHRLFEWTVRIHNAVNQRLGKEVWDVTSAWHHYKTMIQKNRTDIPALGENDGQMTRMLLIFNVAFMFVLIVFVYARCRPAFFAFQRG